MQSILVHLLRLDTLHASLDRIQRLRTIHRDQPRHRTDPKRSNTTQLLAGRRVPLRQLLQRCIRPEPNRRVRRLSRRRGDKALKETRNTLLTEYQRGPMEEATHPIFYQRPARPPPSGPPNLPRLPTLAIIDNLSLNALERRNRQQRFGNTGSKTRQHGPRARQLPVFIDE
jgi:hypothetical protein